jgi:antitoxin component YwqK of YwqJK toxin-antitoxin module
MFHNGVKEGLWTLRNYFFYDEYISSYGRIDLIKNQVQADTLLWNVMYSNGLKNGTYRHCYKKNRTIIINEGCYTNNQKSGTWINKATRMINSYTYSDRHDIVVLQKYTYNSSDSISHQYLIRNKIVNQFPFRVKNYDFRSNIFILHPSDLILYKINFPIPEKGKNQHNEFFHNYRYNTINQAINNEYLYNYEATRSSYAELTEQFGKKYLFEGEFESYYSNGQLMFHFNFKNNQLEKEDTIFWDNGNPQDVICPIIDSNQFTRSIYDYNGTLFIQNLYDAKGNFVRTIFDGGASKQLFIENLPVEYDSPYFIYQAKLDSNLIVQSDTFLVSKSWHKFDTTVYETKIYVPKERKLIQSNYSISGKIIKQSETQFNTQFKTATHTTLDHYGDFCAIEQRELEFFESDF